MGKLTGKAKNKIRKAKQNKHKLSKIRHLKKNRELIRTFNDPVLKEVCQSVLKEDDLSFIDDMKRVLCSTKYGVGISAPQIGITKQAFVVRFDPKVNTSTVMINPVIVKDDFVNVKAREGCLSYPGHYYKIERPWKIEVEYFNEKFVKVKKEFIGFEARVFLHEYDHLSGKCIVGEMWESEKLDIKTSIGEQESVPVE